MISFDKVSIINLYQNYRQSTNTFKTVTHNTRRVLQGWTQRYRQGQVGRGVVYFYADGRQLVHRENKLNSSKQNLEIPWQI